MEQAIKKSNIDENELQLINKYSRRQLTEDEVYVFSVVLCDNDVDRDNERFTVEGLYKLCELFVGKTGILDHNPKAVNQTARIISCKVEAVQGKTNSLGDEYFRLVARAYMPKSEKNKDIILAIDSGITKEVSVGCSVEETRCSICGNDIHSPDCCHMKGQSYGNKLCYGELINPYDAYEWSFVAVPSQREAGVIKAYKGKDKTMSDVIKSIEKGEAVTLTKKDSNSLWEYISGLKKQATDGIMYRNSLVADVLKYSAIVEPEISRETMEVVAKALDINQLKEMRMAFMKKSEDFLPGNPQLYNENLADKNTNNEFTI